ncbi:hypothetical protein LSCM1_00914 [Leishmania martiniquensis]|uniref:Uncharacterized protein n=1 Tax=Leishmania martiniquensis TaxID=1580590 RepID=A0A836GYR5_9TRYP|nr:hypothetical protein LSCM1_00914 [Leishmania martiniquensis]
MPLIRCDEATVYVCASLLCSVVAVLAAARALLYALGVLVLCLARDGQFSPLLEHGVCTVALFAAILLFGDASALLTWLVLLATATSGACCWSRRSFRWIGVGSFVLYSLAMMHVVGPALVQEVDLSTREWFTLAQGQRVLIPPLSPLPRAADELLSSQPSLPTLCIYSYYDRVKIEGSASPLALSTGSAASLGLPLSWSQGLWGASGSHESATKRSGRDRRTPGAELPLPTYRIVATGDSTQISHYARGINTTAPTIARSDRIQLVGRHAAIRHTHVYCLIPEKGVHPMPQPAADAPWLENSLCLLLRGGTVLRNVTIHWAVDHSRSSAPPASAEEVRAQSSSRSSPYAWRSLHVGTHAEQRCVDVQAQLQRDLGVTVSSLLIECADELDIAKLPPLFVSKAPLLVWLGWQLPGYAHRAQETLAFFSSHVAAPAAATSVKLAQMSCKMASTLGRQCGVWLAMMAPYVKRGAVQAAVFAEGALCGLSARPEGLIGTGEGSGGSVREALLRAVGAPLSQCTAFARTHATHSAFRAGAQARTSIVAVASTILDALDLVPGLWSMYAWAWRAEYRVTLWAVAALQQVFYFVFYAALQPTARVLIIAAQCVATLAPSAVILLCYLRRGIPQLRILAYLERLCASMWALEKYVWRYEWSLLHLMIAFLAAKCEMAVYVCVKYTVVVGGWAISLVRRYNKTSFSTHMAVVLLQTALLGIAIRNELKKSVMVEQPQGTPARSLLTRYLPASTAAWLSPGSFVKRFSGFWMLVRAHLFACMWYLLLHVVAAIVLIGLSVLPFASKLYALSLHYVLPWLSCQYFLAFFSRDVPPLRDVAVYFVGRMAVTTVLQDTVGDFLYHVLKDLFIAVGLIGGLTLLLWAWPQRAALAKQVATAITDGLQASPMPACVSTTTSAESSEAKSRAVETAAEDEEAQKRDVPVTMQVGLSDTT